MFRAFWSDTRGIAAVEYGLIAAMIASIAIIGLQALSGSLRDSIYAIVGAMALLI